MKYQNLPVLVIIKKLVFLHKSIFVFLAFHLWHILKGLILKQPLQKIIELEYYLDWKDR